MAGSVSICAHSAAGCQSLSLADLLDRVIQHSARMHGLSNDLHAEFEQNFLPSKNQISRRNRKCHTSNIITPDGKENVQNLAKEELTEVILKLLLAWRDPLSQFHQSVVHYDSNGLSGSKVQEISDMVLRLQNGVEKVVEKSSRPSAEFSLPQMLLLGGVSNSLPPAAALLPQPSRRRRLSMSDYELLHCFRRDSDKVQSYLRILKCSVLPEHGC